MKHDRSPLFTNFEFYIKVMQIVSTYHYRLNARRFLNELIENLDLSEQKFTDVQISECQSVKLARTSSDTSALFGTLHATSGLSRRRSFSARQSMDEEGDDVTSTYTTEHVSEESLHPARHAPVWDPIISNEGFKLVQ